MRLLFFFIFRAKKRKSNLLGRENLQNKMMITDKKLQISVCGSMFEGMWSNVEERFDRDRQKWLLRWLMGSGTRHSEESCRSVRWALIASVYARLNVMRSTSTCDPEEILRAFSGWRLEIMHRNFKGKRIWLVLGEMWLTIMFSAT